eukprot:gene12703-14007_t
MPGLKAFGRRWWTASDELVFPFGISFVLRVSWLIILIIMFAIHGDLLKPSYAAMKDNPEMECKGKVSIYLIGYISLLCIVAIVDSLICYSSSRGSIFEMEKRSAVVPLLYVRLTFLLVEIAWLVLVGVLITLYMSFDSAGRLWSKLNTATPASETRYGAINSRIQAHYEKKWEKSCKALFCCTKFESSDGNIFGFVSGLLSEYFHKYEDLVPSDIVAGLILLRRHQKVLEARRVDRYLSDRENEEVDKEDEPLKKKDSITVHRHQKTHCSKPFNFDNPNEAKILADITHYSAYALAIYGWPFYMFDRIASGACTLCFKARCCASCCRPSSNDFLVVDDNCCECNLAATRLFLKDHDHDIIHISYNDEVYKPPFFVAVDHKNKSVVISCRGTLSMKDVLTDIMIEQERIPVENGEPNWKAHKGMIQAAQYVLEFIDNEDLLEKAFNFDDRRDTKSYNLVVVGHSLGAGVASILSFLLRPKYPGVTCFAYSAVGATFNYDASVHARDFIYSIVVGKDVISRLNLHTLDELHYMISELLQRNRLPKWKILRGCLCQCMLCCQSSSRNSHEDYLDYEFHDIPAYTPQSCEPGGVWRRDYMGGKVVHIVKTQSIYPRQLLTFFGKKQGVFEAEWADVNDFQCILISNLMWRDHIPDTVKNALHNCSLNSRNSQQREQLADDDDAFENGKKTRGTCSNPESSRKYLDTPGDEVKLISSDSSDMELSSPTSPNEVEANDANASEAGGAATSEIDVTIESPDGKTANVLEEMA